MKHLQRDAVIVPPMEHTPIATLKRLSGRLASYEYLIVLLLTLVALLRPSWGVIALGIATLLWPMRWLATDRLSVRTGLDWAALGVVATTPVALWMSVDRPLSTAELSRLLLGIALLYAVANSAVQGGRFQGAVGVVIASGAGMALLVLAGATRAAGHMFDLPSSLLRLDLPVQFHANVAASVLVLSLPVAGALTLWPAPALWPRWGRVLSGLATALILLALVFTQSRGAYLGLLVAALGMAALRWRKLRLPIAALAGLGAVALLVFDFPLADVLVAGIPGREEVWYRALAAISDFPLTGIGAGLFGQIVPILYPYFTLGVGPTALAPHAHNLFLQVAIDLGLPGLVSFMALLLSAVVVLAWLWRSAINSDRPLVWGLAGSLIALAVHGLVDAVAWSSKASPLLWLLLGLIVVLPQRFLHKVNAS